MSFRAAAPDAIYYRVEARNGEEFKVSRLAIQQSEVLHRLVEAMGYTLDDVEMKEAIPIENIDAETLKLIFQWCEHHKGEPIPEYDLGFVPENVVIPGFDAKLMDIDLEKVFNLMDAANYLGIKQLFAVSSTKANIMLQEEERAPQEDAAQEEAAQEDADAENGEQRISVSAYLVDKFHRFLSFFQ
ncbi:hypothetical protein CAEBREN_20927 [Caenorhabditis brenneri]|uniref:SKP1 component POZ domain-containing protein n=1 Tax=Caenorhabditis brenneri TaxID=135651 RepID=G0MQF9_CAEBE|nr:hypothetical protein CAEBREN_20927 [Caenorhabditis brenneri]